MGAQVVAEAERPTPSPGMYPTSPPARLALQGCPQGFSSTLT